MLFAIFCSVSDVFFSVRNVCSWKLELKTNQSSFSYPHPPTSHELQYISVTSGFTRLSMKTKYVCRGLISLYVNFHNNWTVWWTNIHVKICRWGGGGGGEEKEPKSVPVISPTITVVDKFKRKFRFLRLKCLFLRTILDNITLKINKTFTATDCKWSQLPAFKFSNLIWSTYQFFPVLKTPVFTVCAKFFKTHEIVGSSWV